MGGSRRIDAIDVPEQEIADAKVVDDVGPERARWIEGRHGARPQELRHAGVNALLVDL